ncbi:MAG: polysaccharide biosynthesis C-terminal domain-containing protein, partial [Halobacteriaceae archaeon]
LVYGKEFQTGYGILLLLIGARTLYAYEGQFVTALNAINRPDLAARVDGSFLVLNLVLNLVLVSNFGWYGAGVATLVSAAAAFLLGYRAVNDVFGFTFPLRDIIHQITASLVMGLVALCGMVFTQPSIASTLAIVFLSAMTYGVSLFTVSETFRATVKANVPTSFS